MYSTCLIASSTTKGMIHLITNHEQLLEIARSRLKFTGNITIQAVPQSEASSPEFGLQQALTSSNADALQHSIRYVVDSRLQDSDLFHEFCHVKLNEIGFKRVEIIMEQKAGLFSKSEPEHKEMNRAVVFIAESYANALLFKHFKDESEPTRDDLDHRFLFTSSLREIVARLGYDGIAQAAVHRIAKIWSGYDLDVELRAAFEEAFRGSSVLGIYIKFCSIMSELPPIRECAEQIQNMTQADIDSIVQCALKLFANEEEWRTLHQS